MCQTCDAPGQVEEQTVHLSIGEKLIGIPVKLCQVCGYLWHHDRHWKLGVLNHIVRGIARKGAEFQ